MQPTVWWQLPVGGHAVARGGRRQGTAAAATATRARPTASRRSSSTSRATARSTRPGSAKQLNAGNRANPTFQGNLGAGASSPQNPFVTAGIIAGPGKKTAGPSMSGTASAGPSATLGTSTMTAEADDLANGGSKNWRDAEPAADDHGGRGGFGGWAVLVLFAVIVTPLAVRGVVRYFKGTS
ncbi:hypothetical protein ACWED2_09550 [Amycolatopsis sp. NPDC005003]